MSAESEDSQVAELLPGDLLVVDDYVQKMFLVVEAHQRDNFKDSKRRWAAFGFWVGNPQKVRLVISDLNEWLRIRKAYLVRAE